MARRPARRSLHTALVCNGRDACGWINTHPVDLVLLDGEMPDIDGLEALKTIRKTYGSAQLPVITATGNTNSEDVVAALAAGLSDYGTTPIDFPVVLAHSQTHLSPKQAEKALRGNEEPYALTARAASLGI